MTRFHRAVIAAPALALTTAACGSAGKNDATTVRDRVKVSGGLGYEPTHTDPTSVLDEPTGATRAAPATAPLSPPGTAYGATAQQNNPADSTLVFVVDVLGVG